MKSYLNKVIHWLFFKQIRDETRFDKNNRDSEREIGMFAFMWIIVHLFSIKAGLCVSGWVAIGIVVLFWRLGREARYHKSNRWAEFLIGWKLWGDMMSQIVFWPFSIFGALVMDPEHHSFRAKVKSTHIQHLFEVAGRTDHALKTAQDAFIGNVRSATEKSERLQELPEELALKAKTTGACGLTAVTMATASNAMAAAASTNAPPEVRGTAAGWGAGVSQMPEHGKTANILQYARVTLSIDDDRVHSGFFTEIDADQMQYPDGNWLSQCYGVFHPVPEMTVRAGRMFVSAGWWAPAPFSIETIDFPHSPFTFDAYTLQADLASGKWHFLADVSGDSNLSFRDPKQFDHIEGSARIQRTLSPKATVALTEQASGTFARTAIDASLNPTSWVATRAMVYADTERSSTTFGGYCFIGLQPVNRLRQLEVHAQADVLAGNRPTVLTGGVQLVSKSGTYSVTADYEHSIGGRSPSDGLQIRLLRRF